MADLETPSNADELYSATGDDVQLLNYRPLFTGDVIVLESGDRVALLQHPCSMHAGLAYNRKLVICAVQQLSSKPRTDWSKAPFGMMYLPRLLSSQNLAILFDEIDVISSTAAQEGVREAILSMSGVTLLMQRWVHYMTRVVLPTITLADVFAGPFEEADLTADGVESVVSRGWPVHQAETVMDEWLSSATEPQNKTRRQLLADPRMRSTIRRQLRSYVSSLPRSPDAGRPQSGAS